jgi:hypothetical protein
VVPRCFPAQLVDRRRLRQVARCAAVRWRRLIYRLERHRLTEKIDVCRGTEVVGETVRRADRDTVDGSQTGEESATMSAIATVAGMMLVGFAVIRMIRSPRLRRRVDLNRGEWPPGRMSRRRRRSAIVGSTLWLQTRRFG